MINRGKLSALFGDFVATRSLPASARMAIRHDKAAPPETDPGPEAVIEAGIGWLLRAQMLSSDADGGFARHYGLVSGWGHSYPETSGYIIPTLIEYAARTKDETALNSAQRALDWLVSIQMPDGGFQGGVMGQVPCVPVTFNTGQILIGLAAGAIQFNEPAYVDAMRSAADWLVDSQDPDGAWRRHATPFAAPGDKVYETHVAWGLLEAARVADAPRWSEAALRNVHWALKRQRKNGWFEACCLTQPDSPLTHTIGYALRGVLEAYRFSDDELFLNAALRSLTSIAGVIESDGRLAGRLDARWLPAADWVCLTGSAQIAHCFLLAYEATGDNKLITSAQALNRYVRRTVSLNGDENIRGAVRGSYPISGDYGRLEYLNWATKFMIDANRLELDTLDRSGTFAAQVDTGAVRQ